MTGERDHLLLGFQAQGVRYAAQAFADPRGGIAYSHTRRRFVGGGGGGAPENHRLVAAVLRAAD